MARSSSGSAVVVLGGGGFIGTNLCRRLAASGVRVRAFGRQCHFPDELGGVEWFQGDFADAAALAAAMQGFDTAVHLVNNTTPQGANLDMAGDVEKNLLPSLALFDLCSKLGVKRVVFISSGGTVYGVPQQIPTPETAPTDPITAYAISKLSVEKYLALYRHIHGLNYRILRVANPFGPYQTGIKSQGLVAALVARALRNETIEIWGDGTVVRDFIFIDDVVDALLAAMSDESSERIFNIGSGQGRSVREVIASVESVLGRTLFVRWQHARPVDIPRSTLAIERAKKELDWQPKTRFEDGLAQTIQWWQGRDVA